MYNIQALAHLSRSLTRLIYRVGVEPASVRGWVRPSVRLLTRLNMNISETSRPIATKFYFKLHWGGEKAALGFAADRFRTLVSISSCYNVEKNGVATLFRLFFI